MIWRSSAFDRGFVFKGFLVMVGSFFGTIFGDVFGTHFLKTGAGYSTFRNVFASSKKGPFSCHHFWVPVAGLLFKPLGSQASDAKLSSTGVLAPPQSHPLSSLSVRVCCTMRADIFFTVIMVSIIIVLVNIISTIIVIIAIIVVMTIIIIISYFGSNRHLARCSPFLRIRALSFKQMSDHISDTANKMFEHLREALRNPIAAAAFPEDAPGEPVAEASRGSLQPPEQSRAPPPEDTPPGTLAVPAAAPPIAPASMSPAELVSAEVSLHSLALHCFYGVGARSPCQHNNSNRFPRSLLPSEGMGSLQPPVFRSLDYIYKASIDFQN